MAKSYTRPALAEKVRAADLIRAHTNKAGEYHAGWGDNDVALAVGIPRAAVRYIRLEIFGETRQGREIERDEPATMKVDPILQRLAKLEAAHAVLVDEHNGLVRRHRKLRETHNGLCNALTEAFGDERFGRFTIIVQPNGAALERNH